MNSKKDILLCDLDAFFASVEQLDRPELRGQPVLVGGSPEGRGVVSTCSYEARAFGVRSAMPMKKALSLCPQAVVVRGRMERYREISFKVRHIFEHFTPRIEVVSIDEAYLEIQGKQGFEAGRAIHAAVKDELGLPISVGVSNNKLLAKIGCELAKPNRVGALWPKDLEGILWPLSIRVLPGIGPAAEKHLSKLGIRTVKDLATCQVETLARILGKNHNIIQGYANGIDKRSLEMTQETKSISEETTFAGDIHSHDALINVLMELSAGVGYRLRSAGFLSRTITLKLRYSDFQTITRSCTLPDPVSQDSEIFTNAVELFKKHGGKPPWRLAGIQASGLEQEDQLSLLPPTEAERKKTRITETRDMLHKKYGTDIIIQARRLKPK
jgi:DNA polymerase IV